MPRPHVLAPLIAAILSLGSPACGQWVPGPAGPDVPLARESLSGAYDAQRDALVIQGGRGGSPTEDLDDAWSLSLGEHAVWSLLHPTGSGPGALSRHCGDYDPVRGRFVIIGGPNQMSASALSLEAPQAWEQIVATGPPVRSGATAIYDPLRDRIVMFGGSTAAGTVNETWALSLSGTPAWVLVDTGPARPGARTEHAAIYDPVGDRMIVFGGSFGSTFYNDVWSLAFDSNVWSQIIPAGTSPGPRDEMQYCYDSSRGRLIVDGGDKPGTNRDYTDTWALPLDGGAWDSLVTSGVPGDREDGIGVYDPSGNRLVVFGRSPLSYALDLATNVWTPIDAHSAIPGSRAQHASVLDAAHDRVLMIGGETYGYAFRNDLYALSLDTLPTWTLLFPSGDVPTGLSSVSAVVDAAHERVIVFGGNHNYAHSNEVWSLGLGDVLEWTTLTPAGDPPPPRTEHVAVLDTQRNRMIVFGGAAVGINYNDVWSLSLDDTPTWTQLQPQGVPPPGRGGATAIYDPARNRVVIFGGADCCTTFDDAWLLDLTDPPSWSRIAASGASPAARQNATAIYDALRDRMVVYGGAELSTSYGDVWAFSLSDFTWSPLTPSGGPPPLRSAHSAVYDDVRQRMLVFGGLYGYPYLLYWNDTWLLSWEEPTPVSIGPADASVSAGEVRMCWRVAPSLVGPMSVQRFLHETWEVIGSTVRDGDGRACWVDRDVQPGARYGYSLVANGERGGEVWVDVPAFVTAVHLLPARGRIKLHVVTARPSSGVSVDVFDVGGRRVSGMPWAALTVGAHDMELPQEVNRAGIYNVRVMVDDDAVTCRALVLP